jgi:hypothetical protein
MMMSGLSRTGLGLLMVSLGAACGSSDNGNGQSTDAGGSTDGLSAGDVASKDGPTRDGSASDGQQADQQSPSDGGDGSTSEDGSSSSPQAVNLGAAGNFVILAMSAISTVPTSAVTGNLGISPAAASYITGFPLTADATNVFSTTPQVTGMVYASDYAPPTPSNLTTAISDMQTAFTDAAGRAAGVTELGAGNIGGMTLPAGVYKWGTGLLIPTDLTLTGTATDVWIFQIAQDLTVSNGTKIVLAGQATPANIFWQVSGMAALGTTAHMEGVVLSQTAVTLGTGASVHGRLLAQTAVNIDGSSVVQP